MTRAALVAVLLLGGCGAAGKLPPPATAEKPVPYAVPTLAPCVGKDGRPAAPKPLNQRYAADEWAALPPGSKANAVAAQAGDRMNYEDRDRASTSACK